MAATVIMVTCKSDHVRPLYRILWWFQGRALPQCFWLGYRTPFAYPCFPASSFRQLLGSPAAPHYPEFLCPCLLLFAFWPPSQSLLLWAFLTSLPLQSPPWGDLFTDSLLVPLCAATLLLLFCDCSSLLLKLFFNVFFCYILWAF